MVSVLVSPAALSPATALSPAEATGFELDARTVQLGSLPNGEDGRTIVFQVASGANKIEIKRAVEQLLGSKVESIRTSIAHGKIKRQGRYAGRRSDWKKAYVKLREGAKMPEFLEGA